MQFLRCKIFDEFKIIDTSKFKTDFNSENIFIVSPV